MRYLKIYESFGSEYRKEFDRIEQVRQLSFRKLHSDTKSELDNYLTDISDEFNLEFNTDGDPMVGYPLEDFIFQYSFVFPISEMDKFEDIFEQSIFDRIKDDYPDTRITFDYRLIMNSGKNIQSLSFANEYVDDFIKKIKNYIKEANDEGKKSVKRFFAKAVLLVDEPIKDFVSRIYVSIKIY